MTANTVSSGDDLAETVVAWLKKRLPETWTVGPSARAELDDVPRGRTDAAIDVRGSNGTYVTVALQFKPTFGPRDVDRLRDGIGPLLRRLAGNVPLLVVAPWLSQRTQERLRSERINYLDLTGNAHLELPNPTVFIQTAGLSRDPSPVPRGKARVRGPKAGRLIRILVDVRPPYGVRELAAATKLNPGYVSRLLDALDDQALIQRTQRGGVESVEVAAIVRHWAESYDVFKSNRPTMFLAPPGAARALPRLGAVPARTAVTGSFAAARRALVAAPAMLTAYADNPSAVAAALDLVPADHGANVVLLRPFDGVVWERAAREHDVTYVAVSQAAIDCLTGNGRMPAEGEALLSWMVDNEAEWRLPSLPPADPENLT